MPTVINPRANAEQERPGRKLTGRKVLLILLTFFLVVATVDAIMIYFAKTTFRGLDGDRPYEAGLSFNRDLEAAREQEKLGWSVDMGVEPASTGARIVARPRDKSGQPIAGLSVRARFAHPSDRNRDLHVLMPETAQGVYSGAVSAPAGSWLVELEMDRADKVMFRSKNRVHLD